MAEPNRRAPVDYLLIGHLSRDVTPDGYLLGGTAAYAGLTARACGRRVGVVTAAGPDLGLEPVERLRLHVIESPESTSFVNEYVEGTREQRLLGRATDLDLESVPKSWRKASLVHLAPIADEIDPELARAFPKAKLLLTPQGWLRRWNAEGKISRKAEEDVFQTLPSGDIVVLSEEDIDQDEGWIERLAERYPLFLLTAAERGVRVFQQGRPTHVPAPAADPVDPVGAGDIFASAFAIRYDEIGDPIEAAGFANQLASGSVERVGLESVPTREQVDATRDSA